MLLLKPRQDVVFEAIDTSQYIRLFEENRDFILGIDANSIYTGTYTIDADTVYLSYREQLESSLSAISKRSISSQDILPEKLYIDESSSLIASHGDQLFSAEISLDIRHKAQEQQEVVAFIPNEEMDQGARILVFAGLK
jgi:hypothetical protein